MDIYNYVYNVYVIIYFIIYCILLGRIKGFDRSIATILFKVGSNRTVFG